MNYIKTISTFLWVSVVLITLSNCSGSKAVVSEPMPETPKEVFTERSVSLQEVGKNYQIWNGNNFVETSLDQKVLYPNGGNIAYLEHVYSEINYPAKARYNNVGGTVLIEVTVNELGLMETANIKQGIGYGCDEEALKVVKIASSSGFQPALKGGKAVKVKFELPVVFRVE